MAFHEDLSLRCHERLRSLGAGEHGQTLHRPGHILSLTMLEMERTALAKSCIRALVCGVAQPHFFQGARGVWVRSVGRGRLVVSAASLGGPVLGKKNAGPAEIHSGKCCLDVRFLESGLAEIPFRATYS